MPWAPDNFVLALTEGMNEGVGTVSVIQGPPHLILSVGETANMSCDVINTEKTSIHLRYWYMNGSQDFLNDSSRVTVTSNSLTISSVTYNDSGLYICRVRDTDLRLYNGTGTYLSITERSNTPIPYYYLYSLTALVLLLVVILCWRCSPRKESQTQPAEEGDGIRCTQEHDSAELHYSTIMHRPAGQPKREESNAMTGTDEVVYAPVRTSTTYQPFTCDPTDMETDLDATMRMATPYTRHLELGIICLPTSQTPDRRTLVKNQLQPNRIH
ncbi:uncharacterized protein LOC143981503 [Lithobates pipiens]